LQALITVVEEGGQRSRIHLIKGIKIKPPDHAPITLAGL